MRALVILVLLCGTARAQRFGGWGGSATLHYELHNLHAIEQGAMSVPAASDFVLAGTRLHGMISRDRFGYHVGLDLAAGGSIRGGGFAYDVSLFPLGLGMRLSDTSIVTLGAGIGANGATRTLDDALTIPLEARFEVGRGIRLLGRARATYLLAADGRKDGGVSTSFSDELEAMLALRLGRAYSDFGFPTGNGYFFGVSVREQLGARYAGLLIGYSIDMATHRPTHRHDFDRPGCPDCE
jgi:hypothetical protein